MDRKEILKYVGNMQQLAYVRPVVYDEGRSRQMEAYEVKNGPLTFVVMADKGMDIASVSFMGHNLNFLSKPGLIGRDHYDTNGTEAQRSIMGGMLFTCGLEHVGAPCTLDGKDYPMHGRIRTTPAEHVCADAYWKDDEYEIELKGEMREAEPFGENMTLRRRIRTTYGKPKIRIKDVAANEGYRKEAALLLYHMNVGYPLLDEDCEIILPSKKVTARDAAAEKHIAGWNRMQTPTDGEPEAVYIHDLEADETGRTFAAVVNRKLGIGMKIYFLRSSSHILWSVSLLHRAIMCSVWSLRIAVCLEDLIMLCEGTCTCWNHLRQKRQRLY